MPTPSNPEPTLRTDGFENNEVRATYADREDRFVVSLIITWPENEGSRDPGDHPLRTPEDALKQTWSFLHEDNNAPDTIWHVYDRATGVLHSIEQGTFDPDSLWGNETYDEGNDDDDDTSDGDDDDTADA